MYNIAALCLLIIIVELVISYTDHNYNLLIIHYTFINSNQRFLGFKLSSKRVKFLRGHNSGPV